jgi:hypothetical protein
MSSARPVSTNVTGNLREMQRMREEAAERERKDELRLAQMRSERQVAQSAALSILKEGAPAQHEYSRVVVGEAVAEIKLDSHVMKWSDGVAAEAPRGRGVSMNFASIRGRSPNPSTPASGGGFSLTALAKGTAGAVSQVPPLKSHFVSLERNCDPMTRFNLRNAILPASTRTQATATVGGRPLMSSVLDRY